jgi:Tfp pilus assembly protein PilF
MTRLEKLQEFLKADPNDSFTQYAIGLEYHAMHDLPKAIEALETVVSRDPGYVATYYQLAEYYSQANDKDKARQCYQKGIVQARAANDLHTLSELQTALDELDDE